MSAPKRLIDSKAWCPLSFLLEILPSYWEYQIKKHEEWQKNQIIIPGELTEKGNTEGARKT